eukprot:8032616-Lingulodinium_polyedra.AAC.1
MFSMLDLNAPAHKFVRHAEIFDTGRTRTARRLQHSQTQMPNTHICPRGRGTMRRGQTLALA